MIVNFYKITGLDPKSTSVDIEERYSVLKRQYGQHRIGFFTGGLPQSLEQAFATLLDNEIRKDYDLELNKELIERKKKGYKEDDSLETISLFRSFAQVTPSLRGLLDHLKANFRPKDPCIGPPRHRTLSLEVLLTQEEANSGGRLPVEVPSYQRCDTCDGSGLTNFSPCNKCSGEGMIPAYSILQVDYPRGLADRAVIRRDLRHLGIYNLVIEIRVRISSRIPKT